MSTGAVCLAIAGGLLFLVRAGRLDLFEGSTVRRAGALSPRILAPQEEHALAQVATEPIENRSRREEANTSMAASPGRPAAAMHWIKQQALSEAEQYGLAVKVVRDWAEADISSAWVWSLENHRQFEVAGFPTMAEVLVETSAAKLDTVRALIENSLRRRSADAAADSAFVGAAVAAFLKQLGPDSAREVLGQWVRGPLAAGLGDAPFEIVAQSLAHESLSGAAAWLRDLPPSHGRDVALDDVAAAWAASDPEAALAWCRTLVPASAGAEASARAFSRWAELNSVAAAQWFAAHEEEPDSDRRVRQLLVNSPFLLSHSDVAIKWAELIHDDQVYSEVLGDIIRAWGTQFPAEAIRYVSQSPRLTPMQRRQLLTFLSPAPPTEI